MRRELKAFVMFLWAWPLLACLHAADIDVEAEKQSFLPLIPESTYTYAGDFKGRKFTTVEIVKLARVQDTDVFYFIEEPDLRKPNAIIETASFALGVYVKMPDGIATVDCFIKSDLNLLTKEQIAKAPVILKNTPEVNVALAAPTPKRQVDHTFTVTGKEDITVPAGTFKDCLKIETTQTFHYAPPTPDTVEHATLWLARGVGLVKWVRATGRVELLTDFKLADPQKK